MSRDDIVTHTPVTTEGDNSCGGSEANEDSPEREYGHTPSDVDSDSDTGEDVDNNNQMIEGSKQWKMQYSAHIAILRSLGKETGANVAETALL